VLTTILFCSIGPQANIKFIQYTPRTNVFRFQAGIY